ASGRRSPRCRRSCSSSPSPPSPSSPSCCAARATPRPTSPAPWRVAELPPEDPMTHADLVFTGGPVFTATTVRSRTDAVAVRDGRIVALGSDARELVGPRTEVVDLAGRLLVPGFQDAHVHPVSGGLELLRCDLNSASTPDEYLEVIAAYAAAH